MKQNIELRHRQIYATFTSLLRDGWQKSAAVRETASRHQVCEMTVWRVIRKEGVCHR